MDLFTYLMAKKGHNTHRDLFSYLLGKKSQLPSEYQRLEYIESTGTQYINTGRIPSNNEDVKIKCFINPTGSHPVYGAFNKATQSRRHIWSGSSKVDLGWGVASLCSLDVDYSKILNISAHFQAKNQKLTVNGSSNSSNSNSNTNPNLTAYLFARHNNDGNEIGILMRLYSCKIYDNGVLVRNFIPCMRKSDNEVGLYDTVGGQFYTNAGKGKFAYKGYTFVEYIESTGSQYINTEVNADSNKKVSITTQYTDISNSNNTNMFAIKVSGNISTRYHLMTQPIPNGENFKFYYGAKNISQPIVAIMKQADTLKHYFEIDPLNGYVKQDEIRYEIEKLTFNVGINMYLFARNAVNTEVLYNKSKLYSCKIYDNNQLIRNFIPAIRKSDNVVGLYDLANDTFYTNAGAGTFVTPTSQLSSTQSLNTSLLSNEETNIIQEEPNTDEIEEQNDEPIENEPIEEEVS